MKIFKSSLSVILICTFIISLSSCSFLKKAVSPYAGMSESKSNSVMDGFTNKNTELLKELFCDKVKETHDLDKEIQAAFEFINGDIIAYDQFRESMGGEDISDGKVVRKDQNIRIDNIVTTSDNEYKIEFHYYLEYSDKENLIGITNLILSDKNSDKKIKIGEYVY